MKTQRFKVPRNISIEVSRNIRNLLEKVKVKLSIQQDE